MPQLRTPTSGKKIGMQTTLVSTAEVMNKQIVASNSTTTTTTAGTAAAHGRVGPGGDSPGKSLAYFCLMHILSYVRFRFDYMSFVLVQRSKLDLPKESQLFQLTQLNCF